MSKTWAYRGHELRQLEWGLWKALDEPGRYLLCYRPRGWQTPPRPCAGGERGAPV